MSIQLEDSAHFNVSTVSDTLNTSDFGPIEDMEESLADNSIPTTSILSSALSGLLTPTMASCSNYKLLQRTRVRMNDCYSESSPLSLILRTHTIYRKNRILP